MKEKSTILIVDDSELNRTVLANILGDEYNFIEAENGARAIDVYKRQRMCGLLRSTASLRTSTPLWKS